MAGVGFTPGGARRIAKAVKHVELASRGGATGRARWPVISGVGSGGWAKTPGGGIGAAISATKPTSAVCRRYRLDKTLTPPELVDAEEDVTVWNQCGSIGGNRYIQIKWIDGDAVADVNCCS